MSTCTCDGVEGLSETCEIHGRTYHEWVERGDILQARITAVREVIVKARQTPATDDAYHVAQQIADDLEAAVYLNTTSGSQSIEALRAELTSQSASPVSGRDGR